MTKTYKSPVDEAIGKTLNKPDDDGLHGKLFEHLFPVSPKRQGHKCSCCNTFYFDSEKMIDKFGICKNCWNGLKEVENDCPDEDEEVEVIHKHEKNSKCF